ncbi:uncharacterized protein DUF4405 [Rhodobacter aestuarii]|uniref:Flavinylation-associated cytochrome domain-containing protein n=1 Tax=Rhodobacter aestuarii TaxID=453582 RepID=A0A1N7M469_9RHOB|nr:MULTISPECIES: DUF4405 domain-containing protein [Rhodobacter]PTV94836.1 uncharacterized protein DUF4405 [Rhodobacter aestuarii]SIS80916.1 protein of unknown function [Rhodobacter aestuarii]SOC14196.1 uncharacterized protein DUF4405 [Rhodobacter sp. JA431]
MTTSASTPRPPFSNRATAVFLAGFTFLGLALSGLAIALAPAGRLATQLHWTLLGLSRAQWESLHLTLGMFFLLAAGWHIWLHWSVITNLLWSARARVICHRREVGLALVLVGALSALAIADLPPANWLTDTSDYFKRSFWGDLPPLDQGHRRP